MTTLRVRLPLIPEAGPDRLSLDVGTVRPDPAGDLVLEPPAIPMVAQLRAHLEALPFPEAYVGVTPYVASIGLGMLTVRWGSLAALLMDLDRPLWPVLERPRLRRTAGRISDAEMARINIESSAALAWLLDEARTRESWWLDHLCLRAYHYLGGDAVRGIDEPDPTHPFVMFTDPGFRKTLFAAVRADGRTIPGPSPAAAAAPRRALANSIIHVAWRNPVEGYHAGRWRPMGPEDRRFTPRDITRVERGLYRNLRAARTLVTHAVAGCPEAETDLMLLEQGYIYLTWPASWTRTEGNRAVLYPAP